MKFDSQKAFPYPVLRPFSDDYDGPEFQTTVLYGADDGAKEIVFNISYALSSEEILGAIEEKKAVFVSLIVCRDTYYRDVIVSETTEAQESIDKSLLRGEVQILSYVVATKPISEFNSPDINNEFGDGPFNFKKGEVLAQDESESFYIDRDLFKPFTSVFDLVKNDALKEAEWKVNLEQDHVQIAVNPKIKEKIDSARNSTSKQAILMNSLYFSAAMEALYQLAQDECPYDDYKWAQVIRRQAFNKHVDISDNSLVKAVSELMGFPLSLLDTYVFKESD